MLLYVLSRFPAVSEIKLEKKGTNQMLREDVPAVVSLCDKNALEEGGSQASGKSRQR